MISVFLLMLCITIIPMSLYFTIVISRDIDEAIRKCDEMKKWAQKELDRREEDDQT